MKEKFNATDVFTPTSPARLTFVERESINSRLVNALITPGKQIIVYGHAGSGKTTLLVNKLTQLYENHITTRCIKGLTFDHIIIDAFNQLEPYYLAEYSETNKSKIGMKLGAKYMQIKNEVNAQKEMQTQSIIQRYLPPQLTPQALAALIGEINCCWVLEDFHKIEDSEKEKLSQVMKVFMDMSDEYKDLKMITIGAVGTARQVVQCDPEMQNRVSEILVPLMNEGELMEIIQKGDQCLNIRIPKRVARAIVYYSNGLAAVCHNLCLNICYCADITVTVSPRYTVEKGIIDDALSLYIEDASDTLKGSFEKAFKMGTQRKYPNSHIILTALSQCSQEGASRSEIFKKIKKEEKSYPQGNLTNYLAKLQTDNFGKIIRYNSNSGKYYFSNPLYRAFCQVYFRSQRTKYAEVTLEFNEEELKIIKTEVKQMLKFINTKTGSSD